MSNSDSRQAVLFQVRHPRDKSVSLRIGGEPSRQETFKPLQDHPSLLLMDPRLFASLRFYRGDDVISLEGWTQ